MKTRLAACEKGLGKRNPARAGQDEIQSLGFGRNRFATSRRSLVTAMAWQAISARVERTGVLVFYFPLFRLIRS